MAIAANKMPPDDRGIGVAVARSRMEILELLAAIPERYRDPSKQENTQGLLGFAAVGFIVYNSMLWMLLVGASV